MCNRTGSVVYGKAVCDGTASEKRQQLGDDMGIKEKKKIFWSGYAVFLFLALYISIGEILPVKNTTIFLLGSMWIWNGIAVFLDANMLFLRPFVPGVRLLFSASILLLGVAWCIAACTSLANRGIPMLLLSLPFLMVAFFCWRFNKKAQS